MGAAAAKKGLLAQPNGVVARECPHILPACADRLPDNVTPVAVDPTASTCGSVAGSSISFSRLRVAIIYRIRSWPIACVLPVPARPTFCTGTSSGSTARHSSTSSRGWVLASILSSFGVDPISDGTLAVADLAGSRRLASLTASLGSCRNRLYALGVGHCVQRTSWIESLAGDLRFALHYFGRNKLTVAIIVSVFALGIGANTALVTALQSQFQRPAPVVPDDGQVWILGQERATPTSRWNYRAFTYAELRELAGRRETFTHVAGWIAHTAILNPGDSIGPRGASVQFVTPGYFATLGVSVVAGTGFTAPEDAGADMSAVMSFAMAERLYGTPTNALGQRLLVNDMSVRIVGLAPPAFQGAVRNMAAGRTALWMPVSARADIDRVSPSWLTDRPALEAFGRVAPGVSHEQAAAIAQLVVARTLPDSAQRVGMSRTARIVSLHALIAEGNEEIFIIFGMLGFVGLLLLLVTCTNISSLMVAAAVARRQEIAVRLSLGATRARIMRQLLTETTVLAVAGASGGLLVCWWLLTALAGPGGTIDGNSAMPDVYTLAYTMAIAIGTGVLFGLSPALHATRTEVSQALRDSGAGASRKSRLQRGFVVAQIVLSLPLLVILGVTLSAILAEYQPMRSELSERVTAVTFHTLAQTGGPAHRREAVDSLIPRIATHPEVAGVVPEASWFDVRGFITPDSIARKERPFTTINIEGAAPGWFALLDIPIVLGRDVSLADTAGRERPVVVGSDLARELWGNAHPIGQTLSAPGGGRRDSVTVIVVGVYDATHASTRGNEIFRVFTAHGKQWRRDKLLVRTRGAGQPFMPELRRLIRDQAPGLPVTRVSTIAQVEAEERRDTLAVSALVGAGGALALLLASLGLYGVIALAVRQRTREIGIRIALGASPKRVARMFLASGVRLGMVALLIGLPLSMALLDLFLSQAELLAPKVNTWVIGAVVSALLTVVATAATWLPARRAALVDPANTLRID
jgi:putative ABC transport system permease protein